MRYAILGRTGVEVSRLALGTMTFGAEADEAAASAILARARDAGVNFVDTADVYADGRAEEILGRLLRGTRDELVLATKAGFPTGQGRNARGGSRYHLVRSVEASLRRLATDRIDVFYLHRFDEGTDLTESLRTLQDLIAQGKVLYAACSNFAAWQVTRALGLSAAPGHAAPCAIQPMYNLLKRQAEVELLPMAAAVGIGAVPYGPTAGGLLTGKYQSQTRSADSRLDTDVIYQTRYADPACRASARAFAALAAELELAPATLAVAWVASHPAVTSVLLGARNPVQLESTLAAADLDLDEATRTRVSALTPAPPPATDRCEERTAP
jgi:aryl-alcohol dehydrogenase-like predicted oxidoreductase